MRKAIAALAIGGALTMGASVSSALADGMPSRSRAAVAVEPRCASFGGFYVGANVGYAYSDNNWNDRDGWSSTWVSDNYAANPNGLTTTDDGVIGGVQIGYNLQRGCTVFGIEADWSWGNLGRNKEHNLFDIYGAPVNVNIKSEVESFGTIRTRAGVVVDHLLLYVTGGIAFGDIKQNDSLHSDYYGWTEEFSSSKTRWGWVAGIGTEWALSDRITLKSEALYIRFEEHASSHYDTYWLRDFKFDHQDALWVGRVGVNFKFGHDRREVEPMK